MFMGIAIKIISLNENELHKAVLRHMLRSQKGGREFFIKSLEITEEIPISTKVTIERPSGVVEEEVLDHTFLAAAVLRFCMDNKIPLPRKATKNLQMVNGLLSIFLSMKTTDLV